MTQIPVRTVSSMAYSHSEISANVMGTARSITAFADIGGGLVQASCARHGFLTGDSVTIAGTGGKYDGTYTVVRDAYNLFSFTETFDGTTTGTAVEPAASIIYSPLDGLPVTKCIGRASVNATWVFVCPTTQTIYPNTGLVIKTIGYVDTDGSLNTSLAATAQKSPCIDVSEGTTATAARANCYRSLNAPSAYGFTDQWRVNTPNRRNFTTAGTPKAWCTTTANAGFTTTAITLERPSDATQAEVFYLGGVVTENIPKAKLIIGFDGMEVGTYTNAFPSMQQRGWKGQVFIASEASDNAEDKAMIQAVYNAGWDVSNYSYTHPSMDNTFTTDQCIIEIGKSKTWQLAQGWERGADFIAYPGGEIRLVGNNGGDVLDPYFVMGRGKAYRSTFYNNSFGYSAGYSQFLPLDRMNICHVAGHGGSNTDYSASDAKSALALAVLHQGVLNIYNHNVLESPSSIQVSIDWWSAFLTDVDAYIAAGTLEVVTMTEWYNEIYGVDSSSTMTIPAVSNVRKGTLYGDANSLSGTLVPHKVINSRRVM